MPAKTKRDNDYYLQRMKVDALSVYHDYMAGKFPSVAAARRAAKLITPRTRLHEMKNAWSKATNDERKEFLLWLNSHRKTRVSLVRGGRLTPEGAEQVRAIITSRRLKMGEVMRELGFKPLDASLGQALRSNTLLRPALITALTHWVGKNLEPRRS